MRALTLRLAALVACALLSAPAFAGAPTPAADAGSCRARSPEALPTMEAFARLRERMEADAAASGADAPIVLNGRGYNYGPGPDPVRELQVLQAERARHR